MKVGGEGNNLGHKLKVSSAHGLELEESLLNHTWFYSGLWASRKVNTAEK